MKRAVSILILIFMLFVGFEFFAVYLKDAHEVKYNVYYEDKTFEVLEKYNKELGDTYTLEIKNDNKVFNYILNNTSNKQKEIIEKIEYYEKDNYVCIYPVLENGEGTYLECNKDNNVYTMSYFSNDWLKSISNDLSDKGYNMLKESDITNINSLSKNIIYYNNLLDNDYITIWDYKSINIISKEEIKNVHLLSFDKYENKHGYLVGKYYISPIYLSSRVSEFSSVNIVNLETQKVKKIELDNTLSSSTYINGVVDGKLYYTDKSNLIQIEINPDKYSSRLIGNKEIGGQVYNGAWSDANIYELTTKEVKFKKDNQDLNKYSYINLSESDSSYYIYTKEGNMYQILKDNIDKKILLFNRKNLNNINVIDDTVYFVENGTLYYYSNSDGIIPILKNNELRYNTNNRVGIYRK